MCEYFAIDSIITIFEYEMKSESCIIPFKSIKKNLPNVLAGNLGFIKKIDVKKTLL